MSIKLRQALIALQSVLEKKDIEGYPSEELQSLLEEEEQKEQAYEYFYHHVFRARLCTIAGLIDLFNLTPLPDAKNDLVILISNEANRLLQESQHLEAN